jgi:hypothetical protein
MASHATAPLFEMVEITMRQEQIPVDPWLACYQRHRCARSVARNRERVSLEKAFHKHHAEDAKKANRREEQDESTCRAFELELAMKRTREPRSLYEHAGPVEG